MPSYAIAAAPHALDTIADADYAKLSSDNNVYVAAQTLCVGLATPATPTGTLVSIAPTVILKNHTAGQTFQVFMTVGYGGGQGGGQGGGYVFPSTRYTKSGGGGGVEGTVTAPASLFHTALIGSATVSNMLVLLYSQGGVVYDYEMVTATAYYLAAATVATPDLPTGTITTTQRPELGATVSAVVEAWQGTSWLVGVDVEWQIHLSSAAPGLVPPATAPVWQGTTRATINEYGDGTTPSTLAVTTQPDDDLPNGEYVLFVRANRDLPDGTTTLGAWAKSAAWTINIAAPDAPGTLTVAIDDAAQGLAVSVVVPATTGYTASSTLVSLERSDDLGVTWEAVLTDVSITAGAATWDLGYDYTAPRGVSTLQYRARASAVFTASGDRFTSAWKTVTGQVGMAAFTSWAFIAIDDATATWNAPHVQTGFSLAPQTEVGVFRPIDRAGAVTVFGEPHGDESTLIVHCRSAAEVASMEALRAYQGLCVLGTPQGEAKFVSIVSITSTWSGTPEYPYVEAAVHYVEVTAPTA